MDNYREIVYQHIMKRMSPFFKVFVKLEIALCILIFAVALIAMYIEGQFYPLTLILLFIPFIFWISLMLIVLCRSVLNTRPEKQIEIIGYLVDITESVENMDEATAKVFSNTYLLRQTASNANFHVSVRMTKHKWFEGGRCFSFINGDYFNDHVHEWKQNPGFDMTSDLDIMKHSIFFVFNKDLAAKTLSYCSEQFVTQKCSFKISPKCTALYTAVKNVDDILLDIARI